MEAAIMRSLCTKSKWIRYSMFDGIATGLRIADSAGGFRYGQHNGTGPVSFARLPSGIECKRSAHMKTLVAVFRGLGYTLYVVFLGLMFTDSANHSFFAILGLLGLVVFPVAGYVASSKLKAPNSSAPP